MDTKDNYDEGREFRGPAGIRISVPYRPPHRDADKHLDFPPYDPILVWIENHEWDYESVLREGGFIGDDRTRKLTAEQLRWLENQRAQIESMRDDRRSVGNANDG